MLEELLRYNRLANKEELLFLLFKALPLSNSQDLIDLKQYCVSNHFSIGQSFEGTVKLLEFMNYITIEEGKVLVNIAYFKSNDTDQDMFYFEKSDFVKDLFLSLVRISPISNFIKPDAVQRDIETGTFYLRESLIPFKFFGIRNLLLSIGFFERNSGLGGSNLFIRQSLKEFFESFVVDLIKKEVRNNNKMSLTRLKNIIESQEERGRDAEIFVVDFESRRLQGHPFIEQIQRISDENVGAGFDIESFNNKESVFADRYIEVKSYSDVPVFYWSENEIQTAKEFGDKYYLYLVDRTKIAQLGYEPKIFQNPYQHIFKNNLWNKEAETWKISFSKEA